MSNNPLLDFLKSNDFNKPGYADGGLVDEDYSNEGRNYTGGSSTFDEGDVDYSNEGRNYVNPDYNPDYSNEGRNYPPSTNNPDYSNEGRNSPPPDAVGKTPDGMNWVDQLGRILGPVFATFTTPNLNNLQSGGMLSEGRDMLRRGASVWDNVNFTDLSTLIPQLQKQVMQGTMTAAQANATLQQASEMNKVVTDAQSLAAQRAGLARLNDIATQSGMTEQDRAQLIETMNATNANAASNRAAQIQQLQMQGNAGTGAELAARLSGAQGSAQSNAMAGANVATSAQARALAALQSGIQGNANLNQQQWSQQAERAKAQDTVNQFNANAQNQIAMSNVNAQNQANLVNFNMANTIAGKNTDIANQQGMLPLNIANTQNELALKRAQGASAGQVAAGKAMIDQGNKQATNTAGAAAQAGQSSSGGSSSGGGFLDTVGKGIGVVSGLMGLFSDERLKTDKQELSDSEVDRMLGDLTAYKYRYRGNNGQNPQQEGVMAQDMQKAGWGDSVIDTPAGKMIQKPEVMSKALAALANQNDRIRKLEGK